LRAVFARFFVAFFLTTFPRALALFRLAMLSPRYGTQTNGHPHCDRRIPSRRK
jgi:hypothetical protein